jgi:hypothetical protein
MKFGEKKQFHVALRCLTAFSQLPECNYIAGIMTYSRQELAGHVLAVE